MSKMAEEAARVQVINEYHAYVLTLEIHIKNLEKTLKEIAEHSEEEFAVECARAALDVGKLP